jgi:hypothetical protein
MKLRRGELNKDTEMEGNNEKEGDEQELESSRVCQWRVSK